MCAFTFRTEYDADKFELQPYEAIIVELYNTAAAIKISILLMIASIFLFLFN